jgi:4-hydroxy-tetrahydrodipicolinate synthase
MREPRIAGVVPAMLTPFLENFDIDDRGVQDLAARLASVDGVGAVFCTGHAGEVAALSREERAHVVRLVTEAVGGRVPVIAGVYTDSINEAVNLTKDASQAGAAAVTVCPPPIFADGATNSSEVPFRFFETLARRTRVPLVVFQFPRSTGLGYTTETLTRICELPEVVGVKEGSAELVLYERNVRALARLNPSVPVLTSNNTWLFPSLVVGGDGILSGSSSVVAPLHAELFRAVQDADMVRARACHDRLYPLVQAFYRDPWISMHTRMKEALVTMGVLKRAVVRPPLLPLEDEERARIRSALEAAKLL